MIRMLPAFDMTPDNSAIYVFEFYDGEQKEFTVSREYLEPMNVILRPHRRTRNPQDQPLLNQIIKDYQAGDYPRKVAITQELTDNTGDLWLRVMYEEEGEMLDMIFNNRFWIWS